MYAVFVGRVIRKSPLRRCRRPLPHPPPSGHMSPTSQSPPPRPVSTFALSSPCLVHRNIFFSSLSFSFHHLYSTYTLVPKVGAVISFKFGQTKQTWSWSRLLLDRQHDQWSPYHTIPFIDTSCIDCRRQGALHPASQAIGKTRDT